MSLLSTVQVGPLRYAITSDLDEWRESDREAGEHYGYTDHQRSVILLNPSTSPQMTPVVLLHELMHAVAFAAGQLHDKKRDEEAWVVMVSPLLLDTLRRNRDVADYLLREDHA